MTPLAAEAGRVVFVAGFWRRVLAGSIDLICLSPALFAVGWLSVRVTGLKIPATALLRPETTLELLLFGGSAVYGLLALAAATVLMYQALFVATTGATPGQRLVGVRVVSVYGERSEWWRALARALGFLAAGLLLGLGLLWAGFDRERRGLHDWLAGTYVIRSRAP
ncbi:MAG: RDD family protein [Deltaproteobacteria bacterium]|nr:RDD family protein [Deltaproteobacteria bacterium]